MSIRLAEKNSDAKSVSGPGRWKKRSLLIAAMTMTQRALLSDRLLSPPSKTIDQQTLWSILILGRRLIDENWNVFEIVLGLYVNRGYFAVHGWRCLSVTKSD